MDKYIQQSSSIFGSIKSAVLGNAVTREYNVGKQIGSFGPGLSWKIYEGKKKSTGQDVSVFIFDKKLDRVSKGERELIIDRMRRGPTQLTKLRHPRLLTIQHTLEESRDTLEFASEPVFASLANMLGKYDNITTVPDELKKHELYDVEKSYGMFQISEGLAFLHSDVKLIEGNVTPENIIVTKEGHWKLAGFFFSNSINDLSPVPAWDHNLPLLAKPDLNYVAPEYVIENRVESASDMYAFGCTLCSVYAHMKTPYDAGNNVTSYKKCVEQLSRFGSDHINRIPIGIRDHIMLLLNVASGVRPDADVTSKHTFFNDVASMTLKYLDSLVQRDDITKSNFFKSLPKVLCKLPKRVLHQRVLPQMFLEFPNHTMLPFVLPNVLLIAQDCTTQEFSSIILPELKKIFTVQNPVQVLLIFMQKMELLLKLTPPDDIKSDVLPMVFRALESPSTQVQELVLSVIPNFAHLMDYTTMKNSILPRIRVLITKTNSLAVRVNSLVCIGKIIDHLDKFLMVDHVFPCLTQVPSKDPAVLMAMLGVYKKTINHKKIHLEKDYLATKVVPFLLPLAVDPGLNANQFNNFMAIIRDIIDAIEQEHRTKLEQLDKMKEQQRSALDFAEQADQTKADAEMMGKVNDFVLGSPTDSQHLSSQQKNTTTDVFGLEVTGRQNNTSSTESFRPAQDYSAKPINMSSSIAASSFSTNQQSIRTTPAATPRVPMAMTSSNSSGILQPMRNNGINSNQGLQSQSMNFTMNQSMAAPMRAPSNPRPNFNQGSTSSSLDFLLGSDMNKQKTQQNQTLSGMASMQISNKPTPSNYMPNNSNSILPNNPMLQPQQHGVGMQPLAPTNTPSMSSWGSGNQGVNQSLPHNQQQYPGMNSPLIPVQSTVISQQNTQINQYQQPMNSYNDNNLLL